MNKFKHISIIALSFLLIGIAKAEEPLTKNQVIENLEVNTLNYHTRVTSLAKVVEFNFNLINNNKEISKEYKDIYLQFYVDSFNATLSHMALYRSMKKFTIKIRENNSYYVWADELEKLKNKTNATARELASFNKKIAEVSPIINKIQPKTQIEYKHLSKTWELLQNTNQYIIEIAKGNIEIASFIAKEAKSKFKK